MGESEIIIGGFIMLVTLKEILSNAEEKSYAAGSFNTPNLEALRAVIGAAEELNLPVIIQHAEVHEALAPLSWIGPIMLEAARRSKVPVCVHLDHGEHLEYLKSALELGFTSIMYDGSGLPYAENRENTRLAVAMASRTGASVEAELGSMGRRESGAGDKTGPEDDSKIYTDPQLAKGFVRETGIDALACSFGTTHGIYLTEPKLDFTVVEQVRKETKNIPIVMHGGSGVSKEDYHKAIRAGVRKINYFTYMDRAGGAACRDLIRISGKTDSVFYSEIAAAAGKAMKENVMQAMKSFALLD